MIERIDLRSDTSTLPSPAMRRAMASAEVGDEQLRADPTVNRLRERICSLLGTEDAVFLPSATMANEIAFAIHADSGDELLAHHLAHPLNHELGAPAVLARVMPRPLGGDRGIFEAAEVAAAIRPPHSHHSRSRILSVENTTNLGGGAVWPLEVVRSVTGFAREHGLACHLDGARLMNAVVASGVSASDYAACFDSVTLCFSKGLGAPVGAALAGSRALIEEAWRFKHMFGGAMRQSGIIAAGALYALEHNIDRLAADHENARRLAEGLSDLDVTVQPTESNILLLETSDPVGLVTNMAERGVDFYALGPKTCRLVTHLDISEALIEEAIRRFHER